MRHLLHILIILICVFIGCNPDAPSDDIDRLVIRLKEDPERINPLLLSSPTSREVYQYVMLMLGEIDPISLKMTPLLIKEMPSPVKITEGEHSGMWGYDFEILPEAVWSDGAPVEAEDYLFTHKIMAHKDVNLPHLKSIFDDVIAIEIDPNNPKKFTTIVSTPSINLLTLLCGVEVYPRQFYDPASILANYTLDQLRNDSEYDDLVAKDPELKDFGAQFNSAQYSREVVQGAGPYRLETWQTDQFLRLVRKENYWGKNYPERIALQANPQEIIFQIVGDDVIAISQLKSDELDLAVLPSTTGDRFEELKNDELLKEKFDFYTPQLLRYYALVLNNEDPLLNDPTVRKALAHLINVDRLISALEGGNGKRAVSIVSPMKSYYNADLSPIPYDPAKAIALLKEAGWTDTNDNGTVDKIIDGERTEMSLRFFTTNSALGQRVSLSMKEGASEAKVGIDIVTQSFRLTRSQNLATGDFEMTAMAFSLRETEDDPFPSWHSSNIGGSGQNYSRFSNKEADEIMEKLNNELNREERDRLLKRLQKVIYEEQPMILLYSPVEKIVVSKEYDPFICSRRPGYLANAFKRAE